jgi:hypothetical protein
VDQAVLLLVVKLVQMEPQAKEIEAEMLVVLLAAVVAVLAVVAVMVVGMKLVEMVEQVPQTLLQDLLFLMLVVEVDAEMTLGGL